MPVTGFLSTPSPVTLNNVPWYGYTTCHSSADEHLGYLSWIMLWVLMCELGLIFPCLVCIPKSGTSCQREHCTYPLGAKRAALSSSFRTGHFHQPWMNTLLLQRPCTQLLFWFVLPQFISISSANDANCLYMCSLLEQCLSRAFVHFCLHCVFFYFFVCFETWSHYVALAGLRLTMV